MSDDEIRYVYIMGRAHSGTTILDCLLDNIKGIQGCGELAVGLPRLSDAPGDLPPGALSFWEQVRTDYKSQNHDIEWDEAVRAIYRHAHVSNLLATWMKSQDTPMIKKVVKSTIFISQSIRNISKNSVVVDSSKELSRGILLSRFVEDAKIIHLVRDPIKVAASTLHRIRNRHGFRFMRRNFKSKLLEPLFIATCSIGWLTGNYICEVAKSKYPGKFLTVKFEDLFFNFDRTLQKIGQYIGKDTKGLRSSIEKSESIRVGSQISGNKILEKDEISFRRTEKRRLPDLYKTMCNFITMPLLKKYGYRKR